jgi:DNA polymerase III delta prime subunit
MSQGLSTLLATLITEKFGIKSHLYGPIHSTIETFINLVKEYKYDLILSFVQSYFYIIIFSFLFAMIGIIIKYIISTKDDNIFIKIANLFNRGQHSYKSVSIYKTEIISKVNWYFNTNKYYNNINNYSISNPNIEFMNIIDRRNSAKNIDTVKPTDDTKIYFSDIQYNVTGFLVWHLEEKKATDVSDNEKTTVEKNYYLNSLKLYIKSDICITKYLDHITDNYSKHIKENRNKHLSFSRTLIDFNSDNTRSVITKDYIFHDIDKQKDSKIMNSFFHIEKEYLLNLIDGMKLENNHNFTKFGQIPKLGLLLHGEPGTGKSNFIQRVSIYLSKHIIKFNPLEYKKKELYELICEPFEDATTDEVIFGMDEFDEILLELLRREKIKEKAKTREKSNNIMHYPVYPSFDFFDKKDDKNTDEKKEKKNGVSFNNYDNSEPYADYISYNEFLELLQGIVPYKNIIFIATTNKYTELITHQDPTIRFACQQMFRHGRLTPIYFGHFKGKVLKEVIKYYFQQELKIDDDAELTINNSEIMELISIHYSNSKGYDIITKKILESIKTKIIENIQKK